MKTATAALALLLLQTSYEHTREVDPAPERFHYERPIALPAVAQGQSCALLDASLYAHSSGRIDDLRVYSAGHEVPHVHTESREAGQQEEPARVLNLGLTGKHIAFDLAMPQRPYTEFTLDLAARDFYATAHVWGAQAASGARTDLGHFPLFDLRSTGLSRSTTIPLQEVSFPILHVELELIAAPGAATGTFPASIVQGASVPPTRQEQTLYTPVASTSDLGVKGHESLATITVPAFVPVERVRFTLQPGFAKNFSRNVRITARSSTTQDGPPEVLGGIIQRVHLPPNALGEEIRSDQLAVEALLGANLRANAVVTVAVENGDDAPLPIQSVQLEMRQRQLCFDADPGATYTVRYGSDEPVRSPVYDYTRLFQPSAKPIVATLGAEQPNPAFQADRAATRTYNDRHPEFLWVALLLVIGILGTIALHNARRLTRERQQ